MSELIKINGNVITIDKNTQSRIVEFKKHQVEMELLEKALKEELKELLTSNDEYYLEDEIISAKISKGYSKSTIDSKKLKAELPEIFENYSKTSEVGPAITLSYNL